MDMALWIMAWACYVDVACMVMVMSSGDVSCVERIAVDRLKMVAKMVAKMIFFSAVAPK